MKIVHVTPLYAPALGGCETHVQRLSEGLASRGHQVTVLTANVRDIWQLGAGVFGGLPEKEFMGSICVRRFRPDGGALGIALDAWQTNVRGGYRSLSLLLGKDGVDMLLQKPVLVQLVPTLLAMQADVVLSANWYWSPAYCVHIAKRMKKFPLAGLPLFHTAEPWWCNRRIYPRMVSSCDVVIVNTEYEANFVRQKGAARAEVVGVGIEPSAFSHHDGRDFRLRHGLGNHPVVGFVGRLAPNKGALVLLQAMRSVWRWNPEVRVVLAGPRAGRKKEVDTFLENLSDWEKARTVVIDDFPEADKASLFDSFDVFALPSTGESFGIAYLEAWMCQKPVIGARIGPTRCVIDHDVDGLLVDPVDAEDTARAIIELLSDPDRREKMGRRGHAKTTTKFTWEKVVDRVERVYCELVETRRRFGQDRVSGSRVPVAAVKP
jgi:glycosyltransferase involved in cell wall biosynthesis